MRMKYVIINNLCDFKDDIGFVIVPEFENHLELANKLGGKRHCVGAGFIKFMDEKARCYGESVSLGIKSKERDEKIINVFIK